MNAWPVAPVIRSARAGFATETDFGNPESYPSGAAGAGPSTALMSMQKAERPYMTSRSGQWVATATLAIVCVGLLAVARLQAQPKIDAAALYKTHCQLCHGANGTSPMKNASFTDGQWLHGSSPAEVQATIKNGVKGTVMMGFGAKLSAAQVEALARHVRAFDKALK